MKLFSRTTLVALGTAAAITVSGVTAPAFAQQETVTNTTALQLVDDVPFSITQPDVINGTVNEAIETVTIETTGATATKFYPTTSLPKGLFINNKGEITGTPTEAFSGFKEITAETADGKKATENINFDLKAAEEPSSGSSDTDNINNWIKIITAVIGALTTILTFSTKLDSFLK